MSIFDDIEADVKLGTTGDFTAVDSATTGDWSIFDLEGSLLGECFADIRFANECSDVEAAANACRFARVPQLERIALAAKKLEASANRLTRKKVSPLTGGRLILERDVLNLAREIAAFREACK